VELVETLRAAASVSKLAALEPVIAAWQAPAEIYSDPELLKAATAPVDGDDYGEVEGATVEARLGTAHRRRRRDSVKDSCYRRADGP
jgi:hypothetical protein